MHLPTKNDSVVSVVAQSLNPQALNRGVLGSIPESDIFLVDPFTVDEINNALLKRTRPRVQMAFLLSFI